MGLCCPCRRSLTTGCLFTGLARSLSGGLCWFPYAGYFRALFRNEMVVAEKIDKRWRFSYWRDALRFVKRALLSRCTTTLAGHQFELAYEARHVREFADYLFLTRCARDRRCVLDVGANVGATSLLMARELAAGGQLFAFEPSEASCLIIRENALLNRLDEPIEIVNALVADSSNRIETFFWNFVSTRSNAVMSRENESIPLVKPTLTLDSFCSSAQVTPDFIKIDVEGAEGRVVAGMTQLLAEARPLVYVELHAWPGAPVGENAANILRCVLPHHYGMYHLRSRQFVREAETHFSKVDPPKNSIHSQARVLLIPNESAPPPWLGDMDTSNL